MALGYNILSGPPLPVKSFNHLGCVTLVTALDKRLGLVHYNTINYK